MNSVEHPGKLILAQCIKPAELTLKEAAQKLGWSYSGLANVISGFGSVSQRLAERLVEVFGVGDVEYWLDKQEEWNRKHPVRALHQNETSILSPGNKAPTGLDKKARRCFSVPAEAVKIGHDYIIRKAKRLLPVRVIEAQHDDIGHTWIVRDLTTNRRSRVTSFRRFRRESTLEITNHLIQQYTAREIVKKSSAQPKSTAASGESSCDTCKRDIDEMLEIIWEATPATELNVFTRLKALGRRRGINWWTTDA